MSQFNSNLIDTRLAILLAQLETGETESAHISIDGLIKELEPSNQDPTYPPGTVTAATMKQVSRVLETAGPDAAAKGLRKALKMVASAHKSVPPKEAKGN